VRPRVVVSLCLAAALAAAVLAVPAARSVLRNVRARTVPSSQPSGLRTAAQAAPPGPALHAAPVTIGTSTVFAGWALLDRRTGAVSGSANYRTGRNTTESMIKAWIVSDYLRTHPAPSPAALEELRVTIIDSNDTMAQKYYRLGGADAVVRRLISMCRLSHTTIKSGWWSKTQMSPEDAVRYGACVAAGTAAGPTWTPWVLDTMRTVRGGIYDQPVTAKTGGGRWGIIDGLPGSLARQAAIKNGWTFIYADNLWHVNCLAILPGSVLAVMLRYRGPANPTGLKRGADTCTSITRQLVYTPDL
jgi:hypothetical protein